MLPMTSNAYPVQHVSDGDVKALKCGLPGALQPWFSYDLQQDKALSAWPAWPVNTEHK